MQNKEKALLFKPYVSVENENACRRNVGIPSCGQLILKSANFTAHRALQSNVSKFCTHVERLSRTSNYDNVKLSRNAQKLYVRICLGHKLTNVIVTVETILPLSFFSR